MPPRAAGRSEVKVHVRQGQTGHRAPPPMPAAVTSAQPAASLCNLCIPQDPGRLPRSPPWSPELGSDCGPTTYWL